LKDVIIQGSSHSLSAAVSIQSHLSHRHF